MRVSKFGGTSVATPDAIRRVVRIVEEQKRSAPVAVVVSAFGGVTNQLLAMAAAAARRDDAWETTWKELRQRHLDAAEDLLSADGRGADEPGGDELEAVHAEIESRFDELHELARGIYLLRECSPRASDSLVTYGERLSAIVVAAALRTAGTPADAFDTRGTILTDDAFGCATVDLEATYAGLREGLQDTDRVAVITGFTGSTPEGFTTTLGRGGSDYTAALVGAAVEAEAVELWTDVSGVMTADPRVVPDAFPQAEMSYAELMELSHFGAKVVYPPSIHPARSRRIPLWIKNTFEPEAHGTRVTEKSKPSEGPIRGITSIRRVALMRLEGDGMVGVPGIAQRLFGALARQQVSVILISQSSSEHSICFVVAGADAELARAAVDREFELERRLGLINDVIAEDDHTVVAAVGEQMAHRPGIAGRLFAVLGAHGINVRAIAQGSSELNISMVLEARDEARAVRVIHETFFAPRRRRVDIALLGVGRVGSALLEQVTAARERLLAEEQLDLRLVALATSRKLLADPDGLELESLAPERRAETLADAPELDHQLLLDTLGTPNGAVEVLVDCTAADGLHGLYTAALGSGFSVVAANKKPFAGPHADYRALLDAAASGKRPGRPVGARGVGLFFETTAGAGLPVLGPLRDLVRTGDRVLRIDAVLSGTVNAVLDRLSAEIPFSAAVRSAYDDGLTEPHPYEDLSGSDVMRKLCILGRLAGHAVEPDAIRVEPLLDADPWSELELDTFWQRLPEVDDAFEARRREAEDDGHRLRYLAALELDEGTGSPILRVAVEAVGPEHPAFGLGGPDNLVAITTERYLASPLVVCGPGAGPAVTAAGVFADLLSAAEHR